MPRAKSDNDDIIEAGLALLAEGHPVTGWALRTKLGGGKSDRLFKVWSASPEARREVVKAAKGKIHPDALKRAVEGIRDAAQAAVDELDRIVSEGVTKRDARHADELHEATKWAEGIEERLAARLEVETEALHAAVERAVKAEAEAKAVPGLRQEIADLRTMLQAAQAAEAGLRAEIASLSASRDEMSARLQAAEDRERAALERAAKAEGMLAARAA